MNIFVFDPSWTHCLSAVSALMNYRGIKQVVIVRTIFDVTGGVIPRTSLKYDAAIFRIPSVISGNGKDIQPRSGNAAKMLHVVIATMRAKISCIVCPTPWPIWFYEIGTDRLLGPEVFFRPINPDTNVFTGCYIAPNWRDIFDALVGES